MALKWQELVEHLRGHTVAGDVIVRLNKRNVLIGKLRKGVFVWTPEGTSLSENYMPAAEVAVPSPSTAPRRRGPRKERVTDAETGNTEL